MLFNMKYIKFNIYIYIQSKYKYLNYKIDNKYDIY